MISLRAVATTVLWSTWLLAGCGAGSATKQLDLGRAVTGAEDGGNARWSINVRRDSRIAVSVEPGTSLLQVTLVDPDGEARGVWSVHTDLASPCAAEPTVEWVAERSGTWSLEVSALSLDDDGAAPADYEIKWTSRTRATPEDRIVWQATLELQAAEALLTSDPETASTSAGDALALLEPFLEGDNPIGLIGPLVGLGESFYYEYDPHTAEALFESAVALRQLEGIEGDVCLADALSKLATVKRELGENARALEVQIRALDIYRSAPDTDPWGLFWGLHHVGLISYSMGEYRDATRYGEEARAFATGRPDTDVEALAEIHLLLGEIQRATNAYAEAEDNLAEALRLQTQAGLETQWTLNSLGGLYHDMGSLNLAEFYAQKSLELRRQTDDAGSVLANGYLSRATILRKMAHLDAAEADARKALELEVATVGPDSPRLLFFLTELGQIHQAQLRYADAEALFRRAIDILENEEDAAIADLAKAHHDLARLYHVADDGPKAERHYRESVSLRTGLLGEDHPEVAATSTDLARLIYQSSTARDAEVIELLERAAEILGRTPALPESRIDAFAYIARVERRASRNEQATSWMSRALDEIEKLRPQQGGRDRSRAEFLRRYDDYFDDQVSWLVEDGYPHRAWDHLERSRARVLLDQLTAARVDLRHGIEPDVRRALESREAEALIRLAESQARPGAEAEADAAMRELLAVEQEFKQVSPLWQQVVTQSGTPRSLDAVRHALPEGTPLLAYHVGRERSHLFVVTAPPPGLRVIPLVVPNEAASTLGVRPGALTSRGLNRAVQGSDSSRSDATTRPGRGLTFDTSPGLANLLSSAPSASPRDALAVLHGLHRTLVPDGLWQEIAAAESVVIVPDESLHHVPFEALVVERGQDWESARYWLDEGPPISYASSATSMIGIRNATSEVSTSTILSISDPLFRPSSGAPEPTDAPMLAAEERYERAGGNLAPLPGTALEARALEAAFFRGVSDVVVLRGADATERNVRGAIESARLIHVATHGLVSTERSELFASLALTPPPTAAVGAEDDGFLQLFEIYDLKLDAELAILSACDSNVGEVVGGEGAFALSRGFLAAGARQVIASLWKVDDQATALLMENLFVDIARADASTDSVDYSLALHTAKQRLRNVEGYAQPYYWAAFTISGID